jgi:hypothetical protein
VNGSVPSLALILPADQRGTVIPYLGIAVGYAFNL